MTRDLIASSPPKLRGNFAQRVGSKAYIAASIVGLGSQCVQALKAVNCQGGDTLA
jgi:hypothetical protein